MHFMITAYDGTDAGALDRRMSVRPQHLQNMEKVMQTYKVLCAGGITNEAGSPVGSFLVMDFPSRRELDEYLDTEPYVTRGVWQTIRVEPCSAVILDNKISV